jgi:hypothetical protein
MPSYTSSLRLILPATGEYPGTWGTQANNGLTSLVDTSVAGTASITMVASDYTLSTANGASDEARAMFLVLGGTPGGSYNVIVPAVSKLYFVTNNTGAAQTVKTSAGTGISVPNGASMTVRCDGTNVVAALNYFGSLTLGTALPVASGGTGAATFTANNVLLGNGTSAFQVVAPGASGNVLTSNGTTWQSTAPAAGVSTISFGSTGLTPSTATSGAVTVAGTLAVSNGGTGATTLTGVIKGNGTSAFTAGSVNLTSEVTGTLPVANGGTGAASLTANNVLLGNGTSAVQVVAPGANGNVLTSNGTTWSSVTPAGSTLVFLSSVTASNSATVDIETGIGSDYDFYLITFTNVTPNSGSPLRARMKIGGSYATSDYRAMGVGGYSNGGSAVSGLSENNNAYISLSLSNVSHTGGSTISGELWFSNPTSTTLHKIINYVSGGLDSTPNFFLLHGSGTNTSSLSALSGIRFYFNGADVSTGIFRLYGIKNS